MYTLFVLGELMDDPLTGYQLRDILGYVLGTRFKVSWGIIYPLLDKLATDGDITLTAVTDPNTHPQKLATLTETGKKHFVELMKQPIKPGKNEETEYLFKLDNLHHIPLDESRAILDDFIAYKQQVVDTSMNSIDVIKSNANIQPADKYTSSALARYRLTQAQAAVEWGQTIKHELTDGALKNI